MWRCGGVHLGVDAAVRELQVGAVLVTNGAHDDVCRLADLLTDQSQSRRETVSQRKHMGCLGKCVFGFVDPVKHSSSEHGHINNIVDGTTRTYVHSDVGC